MRPWIGREVRHDMVADLAGGRRIEARRAPANGSSRLAAISIESCAASPFSDRPMPTEAAEESPSTSNDKAGSAPSMAPHAGPSAGQMPAGAPAHAKALPGIDREGEPGSGAAKARIGPVIVDIFREKVPAKRSGFHYPIRGSRASGFKETRAPGLFEGVLRPPFPSPSSIGRQPQGCSSWHDGQRRAGRRRRWPPCRPMR